MVKLSNPASLYVNNFKRNLRSDPNLITSERPINNVAFVIFND